MHKPPRSITLIDPTEVGPLVRPVIRLLSDPANRLNDQDRYVMMDKGFKVISLRVLLAEARYIRVDWAIC